MYVEVQPSQCIQYSSTRVLPHVYVVGGGGGGIFPNFSEPGFGWDLNWNQSDLRFCEKKLGVKNI